MTYARYGFSGIIALIACFAFAIPAFAQSVGILPEQIIAEMVPRTPTPSQPVTITLTSFNTDLERARITYTFDGEVVLRGIGETEVEVVTPEVGSRSTLVVTIETFDKGTLTKTITLQPALVDLLYEANNSHTPTFYKGKKLPAHEGEVRVVAIPHFVDSLGRKLDPTGLVYTWKVGDINYPKKSGYGKDSFTFEGSPLYRTKTVSVEVESTDGTIRATRNIEIPAYDPVIRFYQEHPLWGLDLSQAIIAERPVTLQGVPEVVVKSVPYFFSDADDLESTTYDWRMNGQRVETFNDRNIVNLRSPETGSGQARVSLKISHENKILQIAESLFTVIFEGRDAGSANENTSGTNFFGSGE